MTARLLVLAAAATLHSGCPTTGPHGPPPPAAAHCRTRADCPADDRAHGKPGECAVWACDLESSEQKYDGTMAGCVHHAVAAGTSCTNGAAECAGTCPASPPDQTGLCQLEPSAPCYCYPHAQQPPPETCTKSPAPPPPMPAPKPVPIS